MTPRHLRTVAYWMRIDPSITPLHLARRMDGPTVTDFLLAADKLAQADPDDEAGWNTAADAYSQAEQEFLAVHRNTEVSYR